MTQEGSKKTLEDIKAAFVEIPTDNGPDEDAKDLRDKIIENNYKLCSFAELFAKKAHETSKANEEDPKREMLKKGKAALEVLKKLHKKMEAEDEQLRDELMDLKLKRKHKKDFEKNKHFFIEYREKIFPMLMKDCDEKADLIESLTNDDCGDVSENDVKEISQELEKLQKENENLTKTEESIIEIRRKNEAIEVETCKIQVRNVELESELRSFDEFVLENQITDLEAKIMSTKEEQYKREEEKTDNIFKNPNDFPTLLDFLDKSKKLKQPKRRLSSPSRPPSKRRKNKTGTYSQQNKVSKPQTRSSSQSKVQVQNGQTGSRSNKNSEAQKALVMESYGLKMKNPANNSANISNQKSNEPANALRRTYASFNLAKSSNRPTLQRQNSTVQMQPSTSNAGTPRNIQQFTNDTQYIPNSNSVQIPEPPKRYELFGDQMLEVDEYGQLMLQRFPRRPIRTRTQTSPINSNPVQSRDPPKRHVSQDYEVDKDGVIPLQRFPSRPLFPKEPKVDKPKKAVEIPAERDESEDYEVDEDGVIPLQRFRSRPLFPKESKVDKPKKAVEIPAERDESEDYEVDEDGFIPLQRFPSRPLFPKESKVDKPKKAVEIPAKGDGTLERMDTEVVLENPLLTNQSSTERGLRPRKNVKVQKLSPKKASIQDKKDSNRKKAKSPQKDKKNGRAKKKNEMIIDDDNADKLMAVDENADKLMAVDENADKLMNMDENSTMESSANSNSHSGLSNKVSIQESTGSNQMDVDQNVQNQGNDLNLPEIPSYDYEVNMEQESPGNEKDISNIEMFDVEMENIDPNNARGSVEMSDSFERLFCSSPTLSGNLESHQSFDFTFDNSRELDENDNGGNTDFDNFFNFDNNDDKNEDNFFGNNSFKSNEGQADLF